MATHYRVRSRLSDYWTDKNLSLAAKGLLTIILLSKEEDLDLSKYLENREVSNSWESDDLIYPNLSWHGHQIRELVEAGYLPQEEAAYYLKSNQEAK